MHRDDSDNSVPSLPLSRSGEEEQGGGRGVEHRGLQSTSERCDYCPRKTAVPHHLTLLLKDDPHIITCPEHHVSLIYTLLCV